MAIGTRHKVLTSQVAPLSTPRIGQCELLDFPRIPDPRGNLTFVESDRHVPFEIRRVYYLYDVPGGETRGGHAHKKLKQVIVAMSGSFDVILSDGETWQSITLNRSYYGLYIPNMIWRELANFSSGSVCMALASDFYDEEDYFRNFEDYRRAVKGS